MRTLLLLLALATLLTGAPAALSAPPSALTSVLAGEPRLEKLVTLRLREDPLVDLLEQVGRETGVALAATSDTADERVILFARERPAREVLARVAEHFDYTWVVESRGGKRTLVLAQSVAAKRREAALRTGRTRDIAALRGYLERESAELNSPKTLALLKLPLRQRLARAAKLRDQLFGPVVVTITESGGQSFERLPPQPGPSPALKGRLETELQQIERVAPDPSGVASREVARAGYHALGEEQRTALWEGRSVILTYPPESGKNRLPHESAEMLASPILAEATAPEYKFTGAVDHLPVQKVERVRLTMRLEIRALQAQMRLRLKVLGSGAREGEPATRVEWNFTEDLSPNWVQPNVPALNPEPLDDSTRSLTQPVTFPWPIRPLSRESPGRRNGTDVGFADALELLAEQVSYPLLADGYLTGWFSGQVNRGATSLSGLLGQIAGHFDRTCTLSNGYLLFRHCQWADKRAAEPPARKVRRWEESMRRFGSLRINELLEVARLPDSQCEVFAARLAPSCSWGVELLNADLEQSGAALRFLDAMPPAKRMTLLNGQPVGMHDAPQRALQQLAEMFEDSAYATLGTDSDFQDGNPPFVPGTGFARLDGMERDLPRIRVQMRRRQATWTFTEGGHQLIEREADWARALEIAQSFDPKGKPEGLPKAQGDLIELVFQLPAGAPVVHHFLHPTHQLMRATDRDG